MKQLIYILLFFITSDIFAQQLNATISVDGTNHLVITINEDAAFQFNQTVNGGTGFSLVIEDVYAVDPPALTTNVAGGSGISYNATNGSSGSANQMGPFGINYGVYSIRDDEVTFPPPSSSFNNGDVITIQAGTIISNATFISAPPINPGPYNAFIPSDDYFSIAAGQIMLPVELTAFTVSERNKKASLKWSTASEENNQGFQVEHSQDGNHWTSLDFVQGKGTNATLSHYEYIHDTPGAVNYYRLKQVDYDGTFEYSKTVSIHISEREKVEISPNPTTGVAYIKGVKDAELSLFDLSGKELKKLKMSDEVYKLDMTNLPSGIFYIQIQTEGELITEKICKK